MNEGARVAAGGLLTTSELAGRPDFTLGLVIISPSTRTIAGPGGTTDVEPRVMQVLVVLAESAGHVVTRNTLFERCWGGVYVGDDSLNRAVAGVRKLAAEIGGGSFEIETIPRTGYRLTGAKPAAIAASAADGGKISRRQLAGGLAGILALGGIAGWSILKSGPDRRFDALMRSAEEAIRKEAIDEQTLRSLQQAIALKPDSAKALGLFAFLKSHDTIMSDPAKTAPALNQARQAAQSALAIDPKQPYALLAMFELQGSTLDWATRDARLRQIIAIDPGNYPAIGELVLLTQAAGLNRESWNWNERAIALNPFSKDYLAKRALKLWIDGRVSQADKVIDQVLALYPEAPFPSYVRFLIFALTNRPRAAEAMLEASPTSLRMGQLPVWRTALAAFDRPSAGNLAITRRACFASAENSGGFAGDNVMILSALGEVDAAFDIANGFLLSRGMIVRKGESHHPRDDLNDATWRINTQWLFTPPCALLRADPRFLPLCEGMGLTDYWRKRGVRPDYQLTR